MNNVIVIFNIIFFILAIKVVYIISRWFCITYNITIKNRILYKLIYKLVCKLPHLLIILLIILLIMFLALLMIGSTSENDAEILQISSMIYEKTHISYTGLIEYIDTEMCSLNHSYNVMDLSGRNGWELYFNNIDLENNNAILNQNFLNANNDDLDLNSIINQNFLNANNSNLDYNHPVTQSLLNADINSVKNIVFKDITLEHGERILNKEESKRVFEDIISNTVHSRHKGLNRIYSYSDIKSSVRFDALYRGIIAVTSTNYDFRIPANYLDLNWKELCRVYAAVHHKYMPLDINQINNYTTKQLYEYMHGLDASNSLSPIIERNLRPFLNDYHKQREFYSYMRIVHYAINRN